MTAPASSRGVLPAADWEAAAAALQTVGDVLRWSATTFAGAGLHFGHGTDEPWDDAVQLVAGALAIPADRLQPLLGARLLPAEVQVLVGLARQRVDDRVPVPYLTGRAWFAGLEFEVDRNVLIPRSPFAELIERGFSPFLGDGLEDSLDDGPARVLDLCTGSGCIGLAIARAFPAAEVVLSDLSPEALALAARNRDRLGFDPARVTCVLGDLFAPVDGKFDLIVSNPPYVPESSYARMPAEYRHEPKVALTAEDDGLAIVRRILRAAPDYLTAEGWLFVEVGEIAPAVDAMLDGLAFGWVGFERGGDGVLAVRADALAQFVQSAAARW